MQHDHATEVVLPKMSAWAAAAVAFAFPVAKLVLVLGVLVLLDALSGVWASLKRGERPQSYGLRLIPAKFGGFCIMILSAYCVDYLFGMNIWLNITSGAIAVHEFQSIVENVEHITGYKLWDTFVNKLRGKKLEPIYKEDKED